jgi:hypothetical protein
VDFSAQPLLRRLAEARAVMPMTLADLARRTGLGLPDGL